MELSKTQRENLAKLADYIECVPDELMEMGTYKKGVATPECGTVGCVIGHAIAMPGLEPLPEHLIQGRPMYCTYSGHTFISDHMAKEWGWCFSSGWGSRDNTGRGAALRIREFLKNGLPEDSERQRTGVAPYMFAEILEL